jgi:hypothetical protein
MNAERKWLVYFEDGSTWHGDPFRPPRRTGVQVIAGARPTEKGFGLDHGKHYYVWRHGEWCGVDEGGYWDYIITYLEPQSVLLGRTMQRNEDFWAIVRRAGKEGLGK